MRKNEYSDYRSVIADSWNRCIAWGLDHDHEPAPLRPEPARLEEINRQHSELLSVTEAEVLPYYRNVLSNSRCLILLADQHATVLSSWGDERITETRLKPWFQTGANWQEQNCGTNAIGTSIAVGGPVQIQRNEHFLKTNRSIIGSAAPIFDAHRQIAGVLSVFSDAYLPQAHTLGMVRLLSQSVENRLINRQFGPDHFQITLNTTADNFDSPWSGILVCDDSGQVIASNQRADQLLGMNTVEARLDELFTRHRNHILGHPKTETLQLTTRSKVRLSARIKRPTRIPDANGKTKPSPVPEDLRQSARPLDIDNLDYGDSAVKRCATQSLKVLERGLPVLITGETGVGKEVLVKALHRASHRKDSRWSRSTAQPFRRSWSNRNCSVMKPVLSPAQGRRDHWGSYEKRTRAFCSSTRSAKCLFLRSRVYCVFSRKGSLHRWDPPTASRSIFCWLRQPIDR